MAKKRLSLFVCTAAFLIALAVPAYAWMPDNSFDVQIDQEQIPADTAYVDLLMPIPTDDEAYVPYHQENGEKYGIPAQSELVTYCEDGYRSYTFHVADAVSDMTPYYLANFDLFEDVYENNREILQEFKPYLHTVVNGQRYYSVPVLFGSDTKEKLEEFQRNTGVLIRHNVDYTRTEYASAEMRQSVYDFDYCRNKYKYAKMAYVAADGRIIGVSAKVKISGSGGQLNLTLSGYAFSSDRKHWLPWETLHRVLFIVFPVVALIVVAVLIGYAVKTRKQHRKP